MPIVVGRWEIDRANRTATDTESGSVTSLSERESELLGFLSASPGQVFSRTQLLGRVFGSADTPGTVDTYVHYVRRKLGRDVVATVHGLGYRLGS
ncbi:winged helix-turn-helix domain-containing protein [Rhodococcus erythropolis]|uniref:winged helix-turn-helix domain-containing protein n=1 Tax=Rhodococcus erythropolis TaxID=1833 RepID=UPI002949A274|nr:winged helix-turn-helix domain-containing protein [Rhodococcus erythropolis]MDV6274978.1 winged helix-turn-helix domain-containing protein [Rhodococcus erythropolis]